MLANSCSVGLNHKVLLLKIKRIPLLVKGYITCNPITAIKTVSIPSRAELLTVRQVLKDDEYLFGRTLCIRTNKRRFCHCQKYCFYTRNSSYSIVYQGVIGQPSEVRVVESSEKDMTGQNKTL